MVLHAQRGAARERYHVAESGPVAGRAVENIPFRERRATRRLQRAAMPTSSPSLRVRATILRRPAFGGLLGMSRGDGGGVSKDDAKPRAAPRFP
jgi:hypothetical protein